MLQLRNDKENDKYTQMSNRVVWLALCGAFFLSGCSKKLVSTGPSNFVQLGFISGLNGVTEPCGCTSKPLGGLDKMVAQLEELEGTSFGFALSGNTFFEHDIPPGHLVEQESAKANTIAEILGRLEPMAILIGPRDVEQGQSSLSQWRKEYQLPIFRAPRNSASQFRADTVLREIGGHKIGLIGVPGAGGFEEPGTITRGAVGLRAQGAELVIALLSMGGKAAHAFVGQLNAVDVAVSGGEDSDELPKVVNGTLLVNAGIKGQQLGLLGIHWVANPAWKRGFVYNDEGKAKRLSLEKRIKRLETSLDGMALGLGRDVRQNKLNELQKELSSLRPEKPSQPYVTWRRQAITKDRKPAKWATERLANYNRSLCRIVLDSTRDLVCPPPADPAGAYVGNAKCMNCHPQAYEVYTATAHAHAWKTLDDRGKTCDLGCIGCHTVGYEKPGGYCRLEDAEKNKNVGCENCHGPGAGHASAPFKPEQWSPLFERKPGLEKCIECHNEEHSDQFDLESYMTKILGPGHGLPLH